MALRAVLSDREQAVLQLIGDGLRVSDIAARLSLSTKTVSTYRGRILEKLQLTTTTQLIQRVTVVRAMEWIEATFGPLSAEHREQLRHLYHGDE